ncbi:MAG: ABC transporter permease [Candidatus Tectomicrobia bacterium]|nr:ABC transporter permease [Candidatus Tectomicrobia bacterium]
MSTSGWSAFAARQSRLSGFLFVLLLLAGWEIVTYLVEDVAFYIPAVSSMLQAFGEMTWSGELPYHTVVTLIRLLLGFALSLVAAIPCGLLIGHSRPLFEVSEPLVELLRPVPAIAIMPIAILVLGINVRMQVFVIAWASFWPILLNALDGVRGIDPILMDTARTYGYQRFGLFRRIVLFSALPYIMAGLRLSLTISLILAIFVEIFMGGSGLGFLIVDYRSALRIPEMYAAIIMVAVLGYLLNAAFVLLEGRLIRWHHMSHASAG